MTTPLGLSTRFGGTVHINDKDIAKASLRHEGKANTFDVIWDKIKDWFFGTNIVEAKNHLATLYTPNASVRDRLISYNALRDMVGEGYRDRFVETTDATGHTISIVYGDDLPPYSYRVEFEDVVQTEENVAPPKPPRGILRATAAVQTAESVAPPKPPRGVLRATGANVWEGVKDWFAPADSAVARKHIERLYAADASDADRAESYQALKNLAASEYRKNFTEVSKPFGYSLNIDHGNHQPPYRHDLTICSERYLQETSNETISDALNASGSEKVNKNGLFKHEEQLANDLPRADYFIDGKLIEGLKVAQGNTRDKHRELLDRFRSALEAQAPVPEKQRIAVEALASQGLFADIISSALTPNGGIFTIEEGANVMQGNGGKLKYLLSRSGDNIVLRANRRTDWLSYEGAPELSPMLLAPSFSMSLTIAPDGHATVLSANYGSEPYEG